MRVYLLDQEVKVLGELGSEACISKNLSVSLVIGPSRGLAAGAFLRPEFFMGVGEEGSRRSRCGNFHPVSRVV